MMATYAEYLKSCGASEEEIKLLDTPTARKAYERLEEGVVRLARERDEAKAGASAYEERANNWFKEQDGKFLDIKKEAIAAKTEAERFKTALLEAQKKGLIDIAKDLGFEVAPANPTPNPEPNKALGFDPEKYFTRDDILKIADSEGDAIAAGLEIAAEHVYLFNQPLRNVRQLREKAKAAKKSLEAIWMEEYKVEDARKAKVELETKAREDKIRKEERDKVLAEVAGSGNPDLRAPEPSRSPFAPRPTTDSRSGKQPWEVGTSEQLANDRVRRGTQTVLQTFSNRPN